MEKVGGRLSCLGSLHCCCGQNSLPPHSFTSSMRLKKTQRLNESHLMSFKAEVKEIVTV